MNSDVAERMAEIERASIEFAKELDAVLAGAETMARNGQPDYGCGIAVLFTLMEKHYIHATYKHMHKRMRERKTRLTAFKPIDSPRQVAAAVGAGEDDVMAGEAMMAGQPGMADRARARKNVR